MTIEQASEHFGVPLDKLHLYEDQGLFDCHKQLDGHIEYTDDLMDYKLRIPALRKIVLNAAKQQKKSCKPLKTKACSEFSGVPEEI